MTAFNDTRTDQPVAPLQPAGHTAMRAGGTESLRKGLIHTSISPAVARAMVILFLGGLFSVPLLQGAIELWRGRYPQAVEIAKPPVRASVMLGRGQLREAAHQVRWWLSRENLAGFEERLEAASIPKRIVQPRIQGFLTGYLGFGNTLSIVARNSISPSGWLFYQLGVDYLGGPGFLQPHMIRLREQRFLDEGETNVNADPRRAIIQFHRDCQRTGVHLVFVPIPVKSMMQPAQWNGTLRSNSRIPVPNNPDYPRFIADLRAAGVDVFDPTPADVAPGEDRYLRRDTHWTPQWMEQVAQDLADHICWRVNLPRPVPPRKLVVEETSVENVGDLVDVLKLAADQHLFPPQRVTIRRVLDAQSHRPLESSPQADVLLIGDSFSNIYSAAEMKWGNAAGFPHQLARFLGRDIEILTRNGAAASELRAELAGRTHPLRGKRIIIWQVAMHELVASNWQMIRLDVQGRE